MRHIIDDYYVTGGARDYTLLKDTHREDKNGKTVYTTVALLTLLRDCEKHYAEN